MNIDGTAPLLNKVRHILSDVDTSPTTLLGKALILERLNGLDETDYILKLQHTDISQFIGMYSHGLIDGNIRKIIIEMAVYHNSYKIQNEYELFESIENALILGGYNHIQIWDMMMGDNLRKMFYSFYQVWILIANRHFNNNNILGWEGYSSILSYKVIRRHNGNA